MDALPHIEAALATAKPKIIAAAGSVDAAITDDGLRQVATLLHGELPWAVRAVVKMDMIARLLISNRARVRNVLTGKPTEATPAAAPGSSLASVSYEL